MSRDQQVQLAAAFLDRAHSVLVNTGGLTPSAAKEVVLHMPWEDMPDQRWAQDGAFIVAKHLLRCAAREMERIDKNGPRSTAEYIEQARDAADKLWSVKE